MATLSGDAGACPSRRWNALKRIQTAAAYMPRPTATFTRHSSLPVPNSYSVNRRRWIRRRTTSANTSMVISRKARRPSAPSVSESGKIAEQQQPERGEVVQAHEKKEGALPLALVWKELTARQAASAA